MNQCFPVPGFEPGAIHQYYSLPVLLTWVLFSPRGTLKEHFDKYSVSVPEVHSQNI